MAINKDNKRINVTLNNEVLKNLEDVSKNSYLNKSDILQTLIIKYMFVEFGDLRKEMKGNNENA